MSAAGYANVILGVLLEVEEQTVPVEIVRYHARSGIPQKIQEKTSRLFLKHADWQIELPVDDQFFCDVMREHHYSNNRQRWQLERRRSRLHQFFTAVGIGPEDESSAPLLYRSTSYVSSKLVVGRELAAGSSGSFSSHRSFVCALQQVVDVRAGLTAALGERSYDVLLHLTVGCG